MSATVKSAAVGHEADCVEFGMLKSDYNPPRMYLSICDDGRPALINVARDEFLAAVASELNVRIVPADAIVVERGELPEVTADDAGDWYAGQSYLANCEIYGESPLARARMRVLEYIAIVEHLDARPPIDEAQVDALRSLVSDVVPGISRAEHDAIARRLVEAGVRAPEVTA